ncbi:MULTISPECIES: hypothetical protein [Serratia]|uniref:hypothetical protein n=1 Tax=Serratia TaxID=613 RepID=UPI001B54004C|nr:hypothetical protein [Serratia sp. PL17]MBP1130466.1 hypothetical protein [Serratia sp. PL17]
MSETISKAQCEKIADDLQRVFCHVQFNYQGTEISIVREHVSESRSHLVVYFDNKHCPGWGWKDSEQFNPLTGLFWSQRKRKLYPAKRVAEIEKQMGKRKAKEYFPQLHDSFCYSVPYFSSSLSLVRQFKKVAGLTLLSQEGADHG